MVPEHLPCPQFDDVALLVTEITSYELVVPDLAEKTDALAVLAVHRRKSLLVRLRSDLRLGKRPDGKHDAAQLILREVRKEVGLVFHRIRRTEQFHVAVDRPDSGVVAGGYSEVIVAAANS